MKSFLIAISFIVSISAQAHVEEGVYAGTLADGTPCSITSTGTFYEKNEHHPLNERVGVTYKGQDFVLGHPPIVDIKNNIVFFNHDVLQAVAPTPTGAQALIVNMIHSATFEGPGSFQVIDTAWSTNVSTTLFCDKLVLQAK